MTILISLAEALSIVRREAASAARVNPPRGTESVPLAQAGGRIAAENALADRDQPAFHRSTRDGFAVRSSDCAAVPRALQVVGEIAAGSSFAGEVQQGQCVEIMTGAPMPGGADAVVMIENVRQPGLSGLREIEILQAPTVGENIVPRGSEAHAGDVVLEAGSLLSPAAIGVLASIGIAAPAVRTRIRVAILTTGDELVAVDKTPSPSQIRNSNLHALAARVRHAGAEPIAMPLADDDPGRLRLLLSDAFGQADLVLITGGVSKGKYDHVKDVLGAMGARTHFAGVAIRPGKPVVFGDLTAPAPGSPRQCFFGLPGNPVSALVTFELFVRPALALLQGSTLHWPRLWGARLAVPYTQSSVALHSFVPARIESGDNPADGIAMVTLHPLGSQGSGDIVTFARADALLSIPPRTQDLPAGSPVAFLPLPLP